MRKVLVEFQIPDDCEDSIIESLIIGKKWCIVEDRDLDSEGYPTEYALEKVKIMAEPVDYIRSIWWMPDWGFILSDTELVLHTGGWSGNEDIIEALRLNPFWLKLSSEYRGGHYYFKL